MMMRRTLLILGLAGAAWTGAGAQTLPAAPAQTGSTLTITSTAFPDGGVIPNQFTQAGTGVVSPALSWTNVPPGVMSFALILHDLNVAAKNSTTDMLHWMIFNIPGSATGLPEGVANTPQLPDGSVQGRNGGNTIGYRPPGARVPPYHHYAFELYALDTKLALGPDATRDQLLKAMDGHVLGKGSYLGLFHR